MAVYVDDMFQPFGRMIMCHMMADTADELMQAAKRIDLPARYLQCPGTWKEHFDVSKTKRAAAVAAGAIEISQGELVRKFMPGPRHSHEGEGDASV